MTADGSSKVYYKSPIGWLEITGIIQGIQTISFVERRRKDSKDPPVCVELCRKQLDDYFQGTGTTFAVPLSVSGTPFQKAVWRRLLEIPYGEIMTYGEVAKDIGRPHAAQAVGQASNLNPVPILVPCHRVVGARGHLVGYGSGLWRKEWLLEHEGLSVQ